MGFAGQPILLAERNLLNRINVICPVQPHLQKYFRFHLTQISSLSRAVLSPRGAARDRHGRGTGCGGRGGLQTNALARGRRSRVVLTPRRWRQVWRSDPRDDGGKRARSPGRARSKPLKPLRAGMPGDPGATVVTNSCAFYTAHEAAGATGTRPSLRNGFNGLLRDLLGDRALLPPSPARYFSLT
jgi:hypothetical protein